jgi:hypothetical protein
MLVKSIVTSSIHCCSHDLSFQPMPAGSLSNAISHILVHISTRNTGQQRISSSHAHLIRIPIYSRHCCLCLYLYHSSRGPAASGLPPLRHILASTSTNPHLPLIAGAVGSYKHRSIGGNQRSHAFYHTAISRLRRRHYKELTPWTGDQQAARRE